MNPDYSYKRGQIIQICQILNCVIPLQNQSMMKKTHSNLL